MTKTALHGNTLLALASIFLFVSLVPVVNFFVPPLSPYRKKKAPLIEGWGSFLRRGFFRGIKTIPNTITRTDAAHTEPEIWFQKLSRASCCAVLVSDPHSVFCCGAVGCRVAVSVVRTPDPMALCISASLHGLLFRFDPDLRIRCSIAFVCSRDYLARGILRPNQAIRLTQKAVASRSVCWIQDFFEDHSG